MHLELLNIDGEWYFEGYEPGARLPDCTVVVHVPDSAELLQPSDGGPLLILKHPDRYDRPMPVDAGGLYFVARDRLWQDVRIVSTVV